MPPNTKNVTQVKQESSSRPPVLLPGDISPAVMQEFEDGCCGYFDNKEVAKDKQVCKILSCFKGTRIPDWIATKRDQLLPLTFDKFMAKFCNAYLDDDWEETVRRELGLMTQGTETFWDSAIWVQAKNSLLSGTASYLKEEQLHHLLDAGMLDNLTCRCVSAKVNKEMSFKKWLGEVKHIDDQMQAEQKEFESITGRQHESFHRKNILSEPSSAANRPTPNS